MTLLDAIRHARDLGATIETAHHGGELRFSHPFARRRCVVHGTRKDASVRLVGWLRQVEQARTRLRRELERAG